MNKLECKVASCKHWSDDRCCLSGIKVEGPAAEVSSQTCCESFEEKGCGCGASNSVSNACCSSSGTSSIHCTASHCAYHENDKCKASAVHMGCSCQDPTAKSGTECCTFRHE